MRVVDVAAGLVSTFEFKGLTPPESNALASSIDDDLVEAMKLERHVLSALSDTAAQIHLYPPEGWKVNARAPGQLHVMIDGDAVGVTEVSTKRTIRPMQAHVTVPLSVAEADTSALVRVDLAFVLCRTGNEAVCVPRHVAWEIPVQSAARAVRTELLLQDHMASILNDFSE